VNHTRGGLPPQKERHTRFHTAQSKVLWTPQLMKRPRSSIAEKSFAQSFVQIHTSTDNRCWGVELVTLLGLLGVFFFQFSQIFSECRHNITDQNYISYQCSSTSRINSIAMEQILNYEKRGQRCDDHCCREKYQFPNNRTTLDRIK
jgi:hypothetical protein